MGSFRIREPRGRWRGMFDAASCNTAVLVGLLAASRTADRAVITGLRKFLRNIGGALGTTVSGTILNNILYNGLGREFSAEFISQIASSSLALNELDLSDGERRLISIVYMRGLSAVFVSYAVLVAVFFLCAFFH
ncbi:hypothetical protein BJX64DRAFT_285379 [Aspergillus heterothallicus]